MYFDYTHQFHFNEISFKKVKSFFNRFNRIITFIIPVAFYSRPGINVISCLIVHFADMRKDGLGNL